MKNKGIYISINNDRIHCQIVSEIPHLFYKIGIIDQYVVYTKDELFKKNMIYYAVKQ